MALFNYANREITAKIVYYGPGVCGKTTSLQFIHERIAPAQRGRLLSLATETDRTIFFDLLPLKLGEIRGFKLRFQLYTVPGQVKYDKTRKLVLQGADAVVFVADSDVARREANLESFRDLQENLKEQGKQLEHVPLVYEYNKRDLPNLIPIEELNKALNPRNMPHFPTVATKGVGVMETLESISKLALHDIEKRLISGTTAKSVVRETEGEDVDLMMAEEGLQDLTGPAEAPLDLGAEELASLDLEPEWEQEGTFETKPIGYDHDVPIQEIEINGEQVAHAGTLKESNFFDLEAIEDQAMQELEDFLSGKETDEFSFDQAAGPTPSAQEEADLALSFGEEAGEGEPSFELESTFDERDRSASRADDDMLGFTAFTEEEAEQLSETAEPESMLSLDEEALEEKLDFALDSTFDERDRSASRADDDMLGFTAFTGEEAGQEEFETEPSELLDFTLGEGPQPSETAESEPKIALDEEALEERLDFTLDSTFDERDRSASRTDDDMLGFTAFRPEETEQAEPTTEDAELLEFNLGEEALEMPVEQTPSEGPGKGAIESLDIDDSELDLTFGEEEAPTLEPLPSFALDEEELPEQFDTEVSETVETEMEVSEEISAETSFEQKLDELSEEMFTAEVETPGEEFQPDISEARKEEAFQMIADEQTRIATLAKYYYHQGEIYRAKQTVSDNIMTLLMHYTAIETAVKAVALKYETCNPEIASLRIIFDSIEEETGKTLHGKRSVIDNIIDVRNKLLLETMYPDDDTCEIAAKTCERFLTALMEEFLDIAFAQLSPVLARPKEDV